MENGKLKPVKKTKVGGEWIEVESPTFSDEYSNEIYKLFHMLIKSENPDYYNDVMTAIKT
jgi:hypothetical protein